MIHQLILQLQKEAIPVQQSCRILDVSRSGFYEAQRRSAKPVVCKASVYLKAAFMARGVDAVTAGERANGALHGIAHIKKTH